MKNLKIWIALKSNGEPLLHSVSRSKARPIKKVAKIIGCSVEDLKRKGISVVKGNLSFVPKGKIAMAGNSLSRYTKPSAPTPRK